MALTVRVHVTGLCLFVENGQGNKAEWDFWVIDARDPGKEKSKDKDEKKQTRLTKHDPMLWVEDRSAIINPGGRQASRSKKYETHQDKTEMKVFPLEGRERLSLSIGGSPLDDGAFKSTVVSLGAIDRCVPASRLKHAGVARIAARVRVDRGMLSSDFEETLGGAWKGSHVKQPPSHPPPPLVISTCALWTVTDPDAELLRIRSDQRDDIILFPKRELPIEVWIVSWPATAHRHPKKPHTHFKWFYELLEFSESCHPDELSHPIEPEESLGGPPSAFCPSTRYP